VRFFAAKFNIEVDDRLLRRMWNIIHFVHSVIVGANGAISVEKVFELFEGKVPFDDQIALAAPALLRAFRFSVAVLMCVSVGFAPSGSDNDELWDFRVETRDGYDALPIRDREIDSVLQAGQKNVVSMVAEQDAVFVVRLAASRTEWAIFAMESECIRGYWSNEARSILFFAMSSRERYSIQMSVHSLRNITNQSSNQPVGYLAFGSDVIESFREWD
jgi:hypothetical protein